MSSLLSSTQTSVPAEVLGHRIQQSLQVILAGLHERDALSEADTEGLRRELRMLLQLERLQIATAKTAFDSFRQGLAEFGCSPVSRSKVKTVPPNDDDPYEKYRTSKMPPKGAGRFLA